MAVIVLFYLGLSRGIVSHMYLLFSSTLQYTTLISGSLVFTHLGGIKVIT